MSFQRLGREYLSLNFHFRFSYSGKKENGFPCHLKLCLFYLYPRPGGVNGASFDEKVLRIPRLNKCEKRAPEYEKVPHWKPKEKFSFLL